MAARQISSADLISRLVHELRTPVGSLRLLGEQLAETTPAELGERAPAVARGIEQIVSDLSELLDELGELGRTRSGRLQRREETVEIDELVAWTAERLEAPRGCAGSSVSVIRDPSAPRLIRSDGERIRRVLGLLLASAARVSGEGDLEVSFGPMQSECSGPSGLEMVIVDRGAPVEAGEEEEVFVELHPHPRNRRRHGGTKPTLALAREQARWLDGDVRVRSSGGETRMTVTFPDLSPDGSTRPE